MGGLYRRAREYLQSQQALRLVRPDETWGAGDPAISAEDRERILEQIDQTVARGRIGRQEASEGQISNNRGLLFPFSVNAAAVVLIIAGVFAILRIFDSREGEIAAGTRILASAEGKLLRALQQESEEALAAKDREIDAIARRLDEMHDERERLRAEYDGKVSAIERELLAKLQAEEEEERRLLEQDGLSAATIEDRMAAFAAERRAEFVRSLEAARSEMDVQIAERQAALDALASEYDRALLQAETDRAAIQSELQRHRQEEAAQSLRRETVLIEEREAAQRELERLRKQHRNEQLALDRLLALQAQVRDALARGDYETALRELAGLTDYINQAAVADLPAVGRRRQVELFLVESLEKLIDYERKAAAPDTPTLIESAQLVTAVISLIEEAESTYATGKALEARALYRAALDRIPAVAVGARRLEEIEARLAEEGDARVMSFLAAGNAFYAAGNMGMAVAEYGKAMDILHGSGAELLSRILDAGYRLKSGKDLEALERVKAELEAERVRATTTEREYGRDRAELLLLASRVETQQAAQEADRRSLQALEAELRVVQAAARAESAEHFRSVSAMESEIDRLKNAIAERDRRILELGDERNAALRKATGVEVAEAEAARLRDVVTARVSELAAARREAERRTADLLRLSAYERAEMEREALRERIKRYRDTIDASASQAAVSRATAAPSVEHLETKLLIMRIIDSDPIRVEYPALFTKMELFLDALVEEQRAGARIDALRELNRLLSGLVDGSADAEPAGEAPTEDDPELREALLEFLTHFAKLLS